MMLEKEMLAERDILKSNQVFNEWKLLLTLLSQSVDKEEIIELKKHHFTIFKTFLYVSFRQICSNS